MGLESYLLRGPAPAFLVALAVLLAGRRGAAAAALAVALGCAVAQGLSFGWPDLPGLGHFPDPQTEQRMVIGFAVLGPLGLVTLARWHIAGTFATIRIGRKFPRKKGMSF